MPIGGSWDVEIPQSSWTIKLARRVLDLEADEEEWAAFRKTVNTAIVELKLVGMTKTTMDIRQFKELYSKVAQSRLLKDLARELKHGDRENRRRLALEYILKEYLTRKAANIHTKSGRRKLEKECRSGQLDEVIDLEDNDNDRSAPASLPSRRSENVSTGSGSGWLPPASQLPKFKKRTQPSTEPQSNSRADVPAKPAQPETASRSSAQARRGSLINRSLGRDKTTKDNPTSRGERTNRSQQEPEGDDRRLSENREKGKLRSQSDRSNWKYDRTRRQSNWARDREADRNRHEGGSKPQGAPQDNDENSNGQHKRDNKEKSSNRCEQDNREKSSSRREQDGRQKSKRERGRSGSPDDGSLAAVKESSRPSQPYTAQPLLGLQEPAPLAWTPQRSAAAYTHYQPMAYSPPGYGMVYQPVPVYQSPLPIPPTTHHYYSNPAGAPQAHDPSRSYKADPEYQLPGDGALISVKDHASYYIYANLLPRIANITIKRIIGKKLKDKADRYEQCMVYKELKEQLERDYQLLKAEIDVDE